MHYGGLIEFLLLLIVKCAIISTASLRSCNKKHLFCGICFLSDNICLNESFIAGSARVSRVVGKKITKAPAIHMQYALCLVRGVCVSECVCVSYSEQHIFTFSLT